MELTQRDMEAFHEAMAAVQEREPDLVITKSMPVYKFYGLYARIGIEMGIFPDVPKGTDIDNRDLVHPAVVAQFGEEFHDAFNEATTIPKKSG